LFLRSSLERMEMVAEMGRAGSIDPGSSPGRVSASHRLETLAEQALAALHLELVQLVYRKEGPRWVVRLFIDREGGVTLDDCARASEQFGTLLEVEDAIPHSYTLEVSSPGLDRPLVGERDYRRFTGRRARIKTNRPLDGQRNFRGIIVGYAGDCVRLAVPDGREVDIPMADIASGRLEVDLEAGNPSDDGSPAGPDGTRHSDRSQDS
jgi:ribosome maturation factor RimP